jgi:hypothetical protein
LQRGWGALRELGGRPAGRSEEEKRDLMVVATTAINCLRALGLPAWSATADAFEANIRVLQDKYDEDADALLERAHATFYDAQLLNLAACARRRRGELSTGALAARWLSEADFELERLGVKAQARFARAYFSPF